MSNNEQSESKGTTIEQPWRISQKGAVYCIWENLPDEVRSQLKHEDGFKTKLGDFSYHVKKNESGGHIVFRNAIKARVEYRNIQSSVKRSLYRTVEVQILPIDEANKLLAFNNQFDLVGTDPIKVVKDQFFAIVGKKEKIAI